MEFTHWVKTVGKRLRTFRKSRSKTQSELAAEVGMDYRHYQDIEAGKVNMQARTLYNIAERLQVPPCFLWNDNNELSMLQNLGIFCVSELLDKMPGGLQLYDLEGSLIFASNKALKNLPKNSKDRFGKIKIWEIVADAKDSEAARSLIQSFKQNQYVEPSGPRISKHINPNGKAVPVRVEWDYLYNNKKEPIGFACLVFGTLPATSAD